ncbi:MAG: Trk system potassium transporter TrkA [Clostridia bacterium]|nr:Trk system potassium transporter TrkA [Clostridia bacterium]
MNIIIVGCGKVGQNLAEQLNEEGNNITVIDQDAGILKEVCGRYDLMGVMGNGATHSVQVEAGINDADLLIAVTGSDELNLLCCLIAKKAGHCQTIARVQDPVYNIEAPYLKGELGLAMVVNPELAAAEEIARILRFPSAIKIDTFAKGRVELLKFKLPEKSRLVGMSVKEVVTKLHCDVLVCTVERDDGAYIAKGDFVFAEKDIISIIATPKNANDFFKAIDCKTHSVKNVMVIGGNKMTEYLCEILQKHPIDIKVIEKDRNVCNHLSDIWGDVSVINGDASDKGTLLEEGLDSAGAFLALTSSDEENILLSLFAKSEFSGKLVTKIEKTYYDDVVKHLDFDSIIYPKNIASEMIIRYARAMKNTMGSNVETMYSVIKGKVEASEFIVGENSPINNIPLSQLKFKENILVAAIIRDGKAIIPRGYDVIKSGDAVVIVSEAIALRDITDVLK